MKKEEFEKIFVEWKNEFFYNQDKQLFVKDGIVDFDNYEVSNPRILFILKDAYKQDEEEGLLEYLRSGDIYNSQTWIFGTKWVEGIHSLYRGENKDYTSYADIQYEYNKNPILFKKKALSKIALINLSKECAKDVKSDMRIIRQNAENHSEFIKKEIDLCNPQIIIFGGVYDLYEKYVNEGVSIDFQKTFDNVSVGVDSKDRIIIKTNHPQAFKKREPWYDNLLKAIQYINNDRKLF